MNMLALLASLLVLSPEDKGGLDPVVVPYGIDEEPAFAEYALTSKAVAFGKVPRPHLLTSWKGLGVKVLKTVSADPEKSAEYFCREIGFIACYEGAEGVWIPEGTRGLTDSFKAALEQGRKDFDELTYLDSLCQKALQHEDGLVRVEGRRARYYFFQPDLTPVGWENLDTIRLDITAWARRLESLLKIPAAKLPVTAAPELPATAKFKPFSGLEVKDVMLGGNGKTTEIGDGFSVRWDGQGLQLIFETHKGKKLKNDWESPGGVLDFRLYIPGKTPGVWLPYRFHCDLNPMFKPEPRAPARGRGSFLFGTDERFTPFAQAYAAPNRRIWDEPRLSTYTPTCPEPAAQMTVKANKDAGYTATVTIGWWNLYGFWPMQKPNIMESWYVGLEDSPETGKPLRAKIVWPRVKKSEFATFDGRFSTHWITQRYQRELNRTLEVWMLGFRDRYYTFLKTPSPTFNRGDLESDEMFRIRMAQPLFDTYAKTWEMCESTKEHKSTYEKQIAAVQKKAREMAVRMMRLSHDVGLLRRDYLIGRFAGKEPPEPPKTNESNEKKEKGPVLDEADIQLDEEEI